MAIQPWMIKSWQKAELHLNGAKVNRWPKFTHGCTRVLNRRNSSCRSGDTIWYSEIRGRNVGLAWGWIELRPSVIVQVDPNGILANIAFVTASRDAYEDEFVSIVLLNRLVHQLDWQCIVRHQLEDEFGFLDDSAAGKRLALPQAA